MLSLPSCLDAGACRVLLPRAQSDTGAAFPAKAREASRGRHKTPSNGLKKLENLPLTPIFASPAFFGPTFGWHRKESFHWTCDFRECFAKSSRKIRQVIEVDR